MIKKSRKILTLLLTGLLLISSMGVLSVSAEATSFTVSTNSAKVSNTSNTASFNFSNVPETGWYRLRIELKGTMAANSELYTVSGTIGDQTRTYAAPINDASTYPYVGRYYLTKGETHTLQLSFDFSLGTSQTGTIKSITFSPVTPKEISATENTQLLYSVSSDWAFRTNNSTGDIGKTTTSGYLTGSRTHGIAATSSHFAEFDVNVPTKGLYDIYSITAGSNKSGATAASANIYVDGTAVNSSAVSMAASTGYYKTAADKLGSHVYLEEGPHTIKYAHSSGTRYFYGLEVRPVLPKSVGSTSGETEFSFYHDKLPDKFKVNYSAETFTTYPEAGLTFESEGYISSAAATDAKYPSYASYLVKVTDEGLYDISFIGGKYTVDVTVEVDGVTHSFSNYKTTTPQMTNASKTLPSGAANHTAAFKDYVCSIYLTEGVHEIKYTFSTSGYFFAWTIEASKQEISSTGATYLAGWASLLHHKADGVALEGYETLGDGTLSGVYAGHDSEGVVTFRMGTTLYYSVYSDAERTYDLSAIASGKGTASVKITNVATGNELFSGSAGGDATNGVTYATVEYKMGEITLPQGATTLKIESTAYSGTYFLNAFKFSLPVATISADIDAEIAQGEGYQEVTVPIKFEGKATLTSIMIGVGYDKDSSVQFVRAAAGSALPAGTTILSPDDATINPVILTWSPADSYNGAEVTTGTLATFTFNVPKSIAKDYNFTIDIQEIYDGTDGGQDITSTFEAVNGKVTVKSTAPIITLTNASGETVNNVVEGTMNLSVDLNGNDYDFVMFAIYTTDGEYAVLKYSDKATVSGETATGSIENITFETGKTYYAKVFVWDEATCYGVCQTFGN